MSDVLFTWHNNSDSISELECGLQLAQDSNAASLLILACNDNNFTKQNINPLIRHCNIPIFGGIYPKLIYKKQLMEQGCIIIGFKQIVNVSLITQVSTLDTDEKLEKVIEQTLPSQDQLTSNDSFLMFYDALSSHIESFIDCLFACLDHHIKIIGGGAGSLDFKQRPCIFTNEGLLADVIQLVCLQSKIVTGATHGWQILQGPFLVSEAHKQTVKSLNYSPAFNIYKEAIENVSEHKFDSKNFFDIAKHFPLGIEDINNQLVVRDPILAYGDFIECVGNVPVNSMVYLLDGSIDSLLNASKEAAISATYDVDDSGFSATMVFDCISRVLFMQDSFSQELDLIAEQCFDQSFFGVLSLGEIANNQSGAIKLLNKSTVIGSW